MVNQLISAIIQVLIFTAVPFLVYLIKTKSAKNFWNYIGLKKSNSKANSLALFVTVLLVAPVLILVFVSEEFKAIMTDPESVSGKIRLTGNGPETIITILIVAILKTSLSEEIFFRGFLAKRLIAIINFRTGNIIQALIFGAMHTLLFMAVTHNALFLVVIFIFPTIAACLNTYINEKLADGSIIPGWIAHAAANLVSYSLVAFVL